MENELMNFRNKYGHTYRSLTEEIKKKLKQNGASDKLSHEQVEDYCKGNNMPLSQEVLKAIAEVVGIPVVELIANLRACKKAGKR